MHRVVFYSWQSDLPNSTNRGFIQQSLEKAADAIKSDDSLDIEPVIDRDTQGVAGSPDISSTIFDKIAKADVFVADVSIVSRRPDGRPTPNPNVLIELGYAFRALGHERIILVFNLAYGKIEELPFDLKMRRVTPYEMAAETTNRAPERTKLQNIFETAIRTAIEKIPKEQQPIPAANLARDSIEALQPNRSLLLRRGLADILAKLDALKPKKYSEGGRVEDLIASIEKTQDVVAEFSRLAESIAAIGDIQTALEMNKWFGQIFEHYNNVKNFSGPSSNADFDYFKFLGHELLVTFVAFLIKERRWEVLRKTLDEPIPVGYLTHENGPGDVPWSHASEHIVLLLDENKKRSRICLHADILSERHSKEPLASILPLDDFIAADYFLFLRGEFSNPGAFMEWRPWSALYLTRTPTFSRSAENKAVADALAKALTVSSVDELKKGLSEAVPRLRKLFSSGFWRSPIDTANIEKIGSR